jgi:hypothetical protein
VERLILLRSGAMRPHIRPILLLACALLLAGCGKKRDPLTSAQIFLQHIAAGDTEAAYRSAAFGLQSQNNAQAFGKLARDMGLIGYTGAQWQPAAVDGRSAVVRVTIALRNGKPQLLIITLLDEAGAWRVFTLRTPPDEQTGISENRFSLVGKVPALTDNATRPSPPENEVRQIVEDSLLRFNEAIAQKSFDNFYDSVSRKWQDQLTKGQLQRAFQPFVDKKVNIGGIHGMQAMFDSPPIVNSEGLLLVSGHYPTVPYRVRFRLKFFYELPAWKLFGLDVDMIRAPKP